ncbi:MAG TPA: PAS domain S-box protein [Terriglobales bacterium]|jgi:PAS domain S-box-containing protein|nr:PAS domain S-box protein [Terriglobales bacterium]
MQKHPTPTKHESPAVVNLTEDAVPSRHATGLLDLELRESEERYRTLFNLVPVAVYCCDAAGVIQNCNRRAVELWGRQPAPGDTDEKFCGSFKLFRPDGTFMPHEQCPMAEVVSGKLREVRDAEVLIERPDGTKITVVVNILPLKNERGEVTGAINCFYDITKRKATDVLVDSQRQALQLLAEGAPLEEVLKFLIGVVEHHSAEGMLASIALLNEAGTHFQRGIGVSLPEAFNAAVEGVPVSSPTGLCAAALRRRQAVAVHDFNETAWRPFGEFVAPYGLRSGWSVPIISSSGKTLGTFANYYRDAGDPTPQNRELVDMVARTAAIAIERKQAEEALREAGERFRFMAESVPQKMFTAKPNGEVDYLNRQWAECTGLTFDQMKDWGWTQFIHPDDVAENAGRWQHSIDSGNPFQFEHRFRRADGTYRWHLSRALPMRDGNRDITMWIGSSTDIQTIREQEERLRRTEKMAAAGQLAATMAHEINNPLASVTNSLYLLQTDPNLNAEARFFVTTASTELARISRIVKQSLSYYRVGTIPRDLDLGGIVNESLQIFSERLQRSGIELNARIDKGAVLVGFPDELRQVIDNLLLNALEAMPTGGRLGVSVHESFDWTHDPSDRQGIRLTIADTGCGVPKDYRSKIFEPFFTTKPEKGNGLGLWILQGIISKHDGVMSFRSSDGAGKSGTTISVFLPSHSRAQRKSQHSQSEFAA